MVPFLCVHQHTLDSVTLFLRCLGRGACIHLAVTLLVSIDRLRFQGLLQRERSTASQPRWAARAVDIESDRNGKDAQRQVDHNSIAKIWRKRDISTILVSQIDIRAAKERRCEFCQVQPRQNCLCTERRSRLIPSDDDAWTLRWIPGPTSQYNQKENPFFISTEIAPTTHFRNTSPVPSNATSLCCQIQCRCSSRRTTRAVCYCQR